VLILISGATVDSDGATDMPGQHGIVQSGEKSAEFVNLPCVSASCILTWV
jgi:hypothetical protein